MTSRTVVAIASVLNGVSVLAQAPQVYLHGEGVSAPTLVTSVKPTYTSEAKARQFVGWVLVEAIVTSKGEVDTVKIVSSCLGVVSEHRQPNGDPFPCRNAEDVAKAQRTGVDPSLGLDEQALKAAKQWVFKPGMKAGKPVAERITIELSFKPPAK
jgi:hypothetical protein